MLRIKDSKNGYLKSYTKFIIQCCLDNLYQNGINELEDEYEIRRNDLTFYIEHMIKPFMKESLNVLENIPENEIVLDKKIGFVTYLRYLPSYFDQKNSVSR